MYDEHTQPHGTSHTLCLATSRQLNLWYRQNHARPRKSPQVRLEDSLETLQSTWKFAVLKLFLVLVTVEEAIIIVLFALDVIDKSNYDDDYHDYTTGL